MLHVVELDGATVLPLPPAFIALRCSTECWKHDERFVPQSTWVHDVGIGATKDDAAKVCDGVRPSDLIKEKCRRFSTPGCPAIYHHVSRTREEVLLRPDLCAEDCGRFVFDHALLFRPAPIIRHIHHEVRHRFNLARKLDCLELWVGVLDRFGDC